MFFFLSPFFFLFFSFLSILIALCQHRNIRSITMPIRSEKRKIKNEKWKEKKYIYIYIQNGLNSTWSTLNKRWWTREILRTFLRSLDVSNVCKYVAYIVWIVFSFFLAFISFFSLFFFFFFFLYIYTYLTFFPFSYKKSVKRKKKKIVER